MQLGSKGVMRLTDADNITVRANVIGFTFNSSAAFNATGSTTIAAAAFDMGCVRKMAPKSQIIAMVKSNAYGHGLERVAKILLGNVDALGVACSEEGVMLREAGVTLPIVLMEGLFSKDELALAARFHFTLVVHRPGQIDLLERFVSPHPFDVWLKMDTGMHRLGFSPLDVP